MMTIHDSTTKPNPNKLEITSLCIKFMFVPWLSVYITTPIFKSRRLMPVL